VIVDDLYVVCVAVPPNEANTPLVIDADAVLAVPVALQGLQSISRRNGNVGEVSGSIQLPQFSQRNPLNAFKTFARLPQVKQFSLTRAKRFDHKRIV
jgi:hypothetical protein